MPPCTVCGLWYPAASLERGDVCQSCAQLNFGGPSLEAPSAREVLAAYALSAGPSQLTPRQVDGLRRLAARWQAEAEDEA